MITWKKNRIESFSNAGDLLEKDRGGMVLVPRSGVHDAIAEIDFSSMYPSIMVQWNISPETINQQCCPGVPVPNSPHRISYCRKGFIPEVLAPVLTKRLELKRLKSTVPEGAEREGLESHNARFGSVEAHECVTAWGRETLLIARDIVKEAGYRIVHGIVDALWFGPVCPDQTERLGIPTRTIEEKTGIGIVLEGTYDWIAVHPGADDPERGSATRYFGKFSQGTIKSRGIMDRQESTPPFIRSLQESLLSEMGKYRDKQQIVDSLPQSFGTIPGMASGTF